MLTPRFELSQTDNELIVKVHAPYANIKDTEVYVEGTDIRFFSSPYYLRLQLPGEIIENDQSSGSYDCDSGLFTLKFSKVHPNEHFENLDMITTLLAPPKQQKNIVPTIEVISNPAVTDENSLVDEETDGDEWFYPQTNSNDNPITNLLEGPRYGFANKISGALRSFDEGWLKDVVDLPFPDSTPMNDRRSLREANEKHHFSDDHYTADLIQPEDSIKRIIDFQPSFYTKDSNSLEFNTTEQDILKELPNKEFLLTNEEIKTAILSLVDILFSYCYNHRATMGENTSESSWDINKISSTLAWFDYFTSLEDVVKSCIRRSLCYPLYRHWELSTRVLDDVKQILTLGKKSILKSLCEIHGLFNNSVDPRYVLNQLYIRDYLIWVQKLPETMIKEILGELEAIKIDKKDVDLDLVELEAAAWSVLEEAEEETEKPPCVVNIEALINPEYSVSKVVDKMNELVINNGHIYDESTSSDDDSSSSSSSGSYCNKSNCRSCCSSTSSESSSTSNDSDSNSNVNTSSEDVIENHNNQSSFSISVSTDSDDSRD